MGLPEILTVDQLADYLEVPVASVYRWNYLGTGPKRLTIGRHVRYRRADVERWLDERAVSS